MSKRSFRIALAIVLGTFGVLAVVGVVMVNKALGYPTHRRAGTGREVSVTVERGMAFPTIARRLEAEGVIDDPRWFRLYAMHKGSTTKVRPGVYALTDSMTPEEVLALLLQGVEDVTVNVTVREGTNMLEVFEAVEQAGVANADALEELARDPVFLEKNGVYAASIEGYLFPETYSFKVPTSPRKVLSTMIHQHRVVWQRITTAHAKKLAKLREQLDWSEHDVLIMASIVEKEAVVDEERPRIAQVFINRLITPSFNPKKLETDPTIRYGCMVPVQKGGAVSPACQAWDKGSRLRTAQLRDNGNPYNTYAHEGLPPGPICNPGARAMEATVNPDGSKYFFFVAKKDKRHHVFSRTLAEHRQAVDKYQR